MPFVRKNTLEFLCEYKNKITIVRSNKYKNYTKQKHVQSHTVTNIKGMKGGGVLTGFEML